MNAPAGLPPRDAARRREQMVRRQIEARGLRHPRVLAAMRRVPREEFVLPGDAAAAYDDGPLSIGQGQTISQPYVVAFMADLLQLQPDDAVLEVGTGSGYGAAVLACLAARVTTIESVPALAAAARERLRRLDFGNVEVVLGDGSQGHAAAAPYDAIVVTAGAPEVPPALRQQLREGGRLVIPVGDEPTEQTLLRVTRTGPDAWRTESLGPVRFVPLLGEQGW